MKKSAFVEQSVERLCQHFEQNDYNPTPIIDIATLVATADGSDPDEAEIEALRQLLEPILHERLNAELVGFLVKAAVKVIRAAGVAPRAKLVAEILMDCDAVEEGIVVGLAVAYASEGLSEAEAKLIRSIAQAASLPEDRFEALRHQVQKELA